MSLKAPRKTSIVTMIIIHPTSLDIKSHDWSLHVSLRAKNVDVIHVLNSMWHALRLLSAKQGVEPLKIIL